MSDSLVWYTSLYGRRGIRKWSELKGEDRNHKRRIPEIIRSKQSYVVTYCRHYWQKLWYLCVLNRANLISSFGEEGGERESVREREREREEERVHRPLIYLQILSLYALNTTAEKCKKNEDSVVNITSNSSFYKQDNNIFYNYTAQESSW